MNTELDDMLVSPRKVCEPLQVSISVSHEEDGFYLTFNGASPGESIKVWTDWWGGFDKYVAYVLVTCNMRAKSLVSISDSEVRVGLGSVFDMIASNEPTA